MAQEYELSDFQNAIQHVSRGRPESMDIRIGSFGRPTFLYQVHDDDLYTRPSDIQAMFDNIPIAEKELFWIEGTTRRWDGYTHFQKKARLMLEWFDTYMK